MTTIKKYTKKDGSTAYMFKKYLGIDPITRKQKETTRRGFTTKREAQVALSRLEVEIAESGFSSKKIQQTYSEVYFEWLEVVYKNKVKESTYWNTRFIFDKHIISALGDFMISAIDTSFCQTVANKWAKSSPKRYQRFINYSGMVFQYAASTGKIETNPMNNILMPTAENDNLDKLPNFYERKTLLLFLDRMKLYPFMRYSFFFLLAYTGLRKGEALSLTWRDIDLNNGTLNVNKTLAVGKSGKLLIQKPKTNSSSRVISLDSSTVLVLKKWKSIQNEELDILQHIPSLDQLVFSNVDNKLLNPRTPQSWLDSFYNKNPRIDRITVHGFRHTHASLLFEAGATMKQTQDRLGHSNIKTTMNIYTHVTQSSKEETAVLFDTFMQTGNSLGQYLGQKKSPLG